MKKLSIIMVSVLLLSFTTAYSDGFFQDYKNVQNISGSVHTVGKSEVVYSDEQKAVVLKAAVQDNSDSPAAYWAMPEMDIDPQREHIYVSYSFKISATENLTANRYLKLVWGDNGDLAGASNASLINIARNAVRVGSNVYPRVLVNSGTPYRVSAKINLQSKKITVYIDGELVAENIDFSADNMDISSLRMMFHNYYTKTAFDSYSDMYIYDFSATTGDTLNVTSSLGEGDHNLVTVESLTNGINLNFSTPLISAPAVTMTVCDLNGENETDFPIDFEFNGFGGTIRKKDVEFDHMKLYKITVAGVITFSGNAAPVQLSFATLDDGYVPTTIAFSNPADGAVARPGKNVTLSVNITQGSSRFVSLSYYVNGELLSTLYEPSEYIWTTPSRAGAYVLKAVVLDEANVAAGAEITVEVIENIPPAVEISDIGNMVVRNEVGELSISADDADGYVERIEIYANDELAETVYAESAVLPLSELPLGDNSVIVKAYDNEGAVTTSEAIFKLIVSGTNEMLRVNFEGFKENATIPGCIIKKDFSYARPVVLDDEHGTSIAFGTTEELASHGTIDAYIDFNFAYGVSSAVLEFEAYVEESTYFDILTRGSDTTGGLQQEWSHLIGYEGELVLTNGTEKTRIPMTNFEWHKFKYVVSAITHTYSFYLDDVLVAENYKLANDKYVTFNRQFRLNMKALPAKYEKVVLDNVVLKELYYMPYFVSVKDSQGSPSLIDYTSDYIEVEMSASLQNATADNFELFNNNGAVEIEKVEVDSVDANKLYIYVKGGLLSSADYTLVMKAGTATIYGTMESDTVIRFGTTSRDFDVLSGGFGKAGKISFNATMQNMTYEDRNFTVVLAVYRSGVFEKVYSLSGELAAGETQTFTLTADEWQSNDYEAYAFVINNWKERIPISDKLFYSKNK